MRHRPPILVSRMGEKKLLGFLKLDDGTGKAMAQAVRNHGKKTLSLCFAR